MRHQVIIGILAIIACVVAGSSADDAEIELVIEKGLRRLEIRRGAESLGAHRVGLGFEPVADKRREGDGATPEGDYQICVKSPHSRYFLSLGLSYPNPDDAARGLAAGQISSSDYDEIIEAHRRGQCPPWDTALGGEIFIHGRGSSSDWTLGCIALDDTAITELYEFVTVGTKLTISP